MTKLPEQKGKDLRDPATQDPAHTGNKSPIDADKLKDETDQLKATQFDGNDELVQAPERTFGPRDDTPWKLEKKG